MPEAGLHWSLLVDLHGLAVVRGTGERAAVEPGPALYRVTRPWRHPGTAAVEAGLLETCADAGG